MALQKTITLNDNQIEIENAYLKITTLTIISLGNTNICNIVIYAYKDKIYSDSNSIPLISYSESFEPIFGSNVSDIKFQAYEYLKNLESYKHAVDLLDDGQTT